MLEWMQTEPIFTLMGSSWISACLLCVNFSKHILCTRHYSLHYATGVTDYFQQRALNPLGLPQYSAEVIVMTLVSKCIHDPLIPT